MDHPTLLLFVKITIFTLMFAIGFNLAIKDLISLWRRPALLLRSLLAVIVLVPLAVLLLLRMFELPTAVATGLAVLAAAPGAPLMWKRSQMAGGGLAYSASLQLTLALLAVLVTPLTLSVFHALHELQSESVTSFEVARQVAQVQLLPLSLGLVVRHFGPRLVLPISKPLNLVANILFVTLFIVAIVPGTRMIAHLGALPILAIVMIVTISLIVGHLLGGPTREERAGLAIASVARNIGLALFITTLNGVEKEIVPTLLAYMILGAIVAVPYSLWCKRRLARAE